MLKKKLKQACALIQAAAFSVMCLNGTVVAYAENTKSIINNEKNLEPSYIYMLETPSPTGEVAVKFVDEFGNEVDFDLIPNINMADDYGPYYNLYDENRATSVKDQGQEGLCWAHAGMSALESNLITQNMEPPSVDLSEKHMAWFTNGVGPTDINDPLYGDIDTEYGTAAYDEGGNIFGFTATIARGSGPVYESVVPYSTKTALSEDLRYQSLYQLEDMTLFDPSDRTAIKKALVNNGVVYINYCSSSTYLNNSSNGYCYYCPTAYQTNHAVSIVGWDDNFSKDNFKNTPEGDGAWIIKNSWGTDWGDDGFFYLSYYDATVETVGTFTMGEVEDSINVYQYDGNYYIGVRYSCGISMANIFTSDSDEQLEAISFWTRDAQVPYTIHVYTDVPEGGLPTSGDLVYTQNGTMNYAGYHKVAINTPIALNKGCRYSVVVDLLKDGTSAVLDSNSTDTGLSFYSAYYEGYSDPYDWKDAKTQRNCNVCLKAFTSETAGLPISSSTFPDAAFRQYVSNNFDTDKNGFFTQAELDAVKKIDISGTEASPNTVATLKGIEYFTKLTNLDCSYNKLTSLDVSSHTNLSNLVCSGNMLTSLDLSNNNALRLLICADNRYSIGDVVGGCSLSVLPTGFDPNKASDWTNATYDPATNYIKDFTSTEVSYSYDCGNGFSMTFTLTASSYKNDYVVKVNEEAFPDATFRQYVSDNFDTDGNGRLTQTELDSATSIDISGTSGTPNTVADLSGIEYFTKLTRLDCAHNQLTTLDVSNNTALKYLYCYNNQLTSLNVRNADNLNTLYCYDNNLTSLDASGLSNLTSLSCNNNQLTSLNVSGSANLKTLSCYNNQLASLNVSDNINLSSLSCYNNLLASLDVSDNTALTYLNVRDNLLTTLDVSNNTALTNLACSSNQLTSLDVSNNTSLNSLSCLSNSYSIGNVTGSYSLNKLPSGFDPAKASSWSGATYDSNTNSLTNFTSTKVTYTYDCGNNKSATFKLVAESAAAIDVVDINAAKFPDATFRQYVSDNFDTDNSGGLSQSEIDAVTSINVSGTSDTPNTVTSLKGIEYFTKLKTLFCAYCQLTSLDVSRNTALKELYCNNNQLTELDVRSNTALTTLTCSNNQLTSLDLSNNTALMNLYCNGNTYSIGDVTGSYSLNDLPEGFDPAKASSWSGATYDSATNSLTNFTSTTVSYTYDCGNNKSATFKLAADSVTAIDVVEINEASFPDATFRQYVSDNFDKDNSGGLSQTELDDVTEIDVSGASNAYKNISSLAGIEYFKKLKTLRCSFTNLTTLDVSNNTNLTDLSCSSNQLTSLDISNNSALTNFSCYNNKYSIGDVVYNYSLSNLPTGFDPSKAFDWTGATYDSNTNSLTDFTSRTVTFTYSCGRSKTATFMLVADSVTAHEVVEINETTFPDDTFRQYVSDNFDKDNSGGLSQTELDDVTSINVSGTYVNPNTISDLTGIEYFTKLTTLSCACNQLTSVDVSDNTDLTYLDISGNQLTALEISQNEALTYLDVQSNQLTALNVDKNTLLTSLYVDNNDLSSLDVRNNKALLYLSANENQLTDLDLSNNTELTLLDIGSNEFTSIELSNNTSLTTLYAAFNKISSLDLSNNAELETLDIISNQLTTLDVSKNTALKTISVGSNQLTSLDLSKNTSVTTLNCDFNSYSIGNVFDSYSLSDLPEGFDPEKASGWTGAEYDASTGSLINITSSTITYTYSLGNGSTADFTLTCTPIVISSVTINENNVVVKYSDNSEKTYSFREVTEKIVDFMIDTDIDLCIDFVNAFTFADDSIILTNAQIKAIDAVLAHDYNT